jgi:hypothetical protein
MAKAALQDAPSEHDLDLSSDTGATVTPDASNEPERNTLEQKRKLGSISTSDDPQEGNEKAKGAKN